MALTELPVGTVVQVVNSTTTAYASGTTAIPHDDTIPQNTEGDEYMTCAITPSSATNKLLITVVANIGGAALTTGHATVALFQDSTAGALAAVSAFGPAATAYCYTPVTFEHYMTAGTTSATTFKVRAGRGATGTLKFNGLNASESRGYGGVMSSTITIKEIKA